MMSLGYGQSYVTFARKVRNRRLRPSCAACGGTRPEFGGCFVFCLVRGGMRMACFHYISGVGLGDGGVVPGAGVGSDGGEGSGLFYRGPNRASGSTV